MGYIYDTQVTFGRNGPVGFTSGQRLVELMSVPVYNLLLLIMMRMKYE